MIKPVLFASSLLLGSMSAQAAPGPEQSAYYTAPHQVKALEVYRELISIRSAAGHGQVPVVAQYLADEFLAAGFAAEEIHLLPFESNKGEKITGLVVRYPGINSAGEKPILLTAHMDVVDAIRSDWERDPFTLVEEDGYFFGRGTLDDKLGVTALSSTFIRLKKEGFVPGRDLIIAFTGDEETGMISTRGLVTTHRDLTDAEFALNADAGGGRYNSNGEPASYSLQAAEKTYATFEMTARNPGGHSSMPRPDNAIYDLMRALQKIEAHTFPVKHNEITVKYFAMSAATTPGDLGKAMASFAADPGNSDAAKRISMEPTLVGTIKTTCITTMLRAGHAENALPQSATATVNCRIFPGTSVESVQQTLQQVIANPTLEVVVLDEPTASPASPLREDVLAAITKAVHKLYPGIPIIPSQSSGGTDGKEFRAVGIPTYGTFGAFIAPKDIFAHGLNERLPVKSFYDALDHWHMVLIDLAGN